MDVHPQEGPEVRGRHPDHLGRHQVRHRALLRAGTLRRCPYLRDWLSGAADYQGPYKDKKGLAAIGTPDERTIVFHLNKPEGEFPYLATQTQFTPVPKAKDTGTKYEEHPVSSGPYKVVENQNDGERLVLERNAHWSEDDQRKAYPDKIDVRSGLDSSVINQRLSASQGADAAAVTTDTNLGPAELAKVTGDKELASRVGTGHFGYTNYIAFNPKVKPFDNAKVRQAVSYAIDRSSVVNAAADPRWRSPRPPSCPTRSPSATRRTTSSRRAERATRPRPRSCLRRPVTRTGSPSP